MLDHPCPRRQAPSIRKNAEEWEDGYRRLDLIFTSSAAYALLKVGQRTVYVTPRCYKHLVEIIVALQRVNINVVVEQSSGRIQVTAFSAGRVHDFALFQKSRLWLSAASRCLGDAGYRGIKRWYDNSQTPHKKSKHHVLTAEHKEENQVLSGQRMVVDHVLARLKVFRILSERYRNRRKPFRLRFNLLAAVCNQLVSSA